jgi:DNA-binding MarR family transcriptional regulator
MNAWLNLRHLLESVSRDSDFGKLDDRSQRLLEWVVTHHDPTEPTFVQTIVTDSHVASPATVHKCLAILERHGFLLFEIDTTDSRRRIVSPTEKSWRLFQGLGQKVAAWAIEMSKR